MPCFNFQCTKPKEIVVNLLDFLTDESQMGTGKAWKLKDIAQPSDFTDKCILMANGDGKDEIYVGISLKTDKDYGQEDIRFNGYAGYDEGLKWEEQPGVIYHATLPVIPLPRNAKFVCWVTANSRRFILVVQVSTQYESAYVGFLKPVSVERQYPYPLVVAGSAYDGVRWDSYADSHSCWTNPHGSGYNTSFRLRRSDGTWESVFYLISMHVMGKQYFLQFLSSMLSQMPTGVLLCMWFLAENSEFIYITRSLFHTSIDYTAGQHRFTILSKNKIKSERLLYTNVNNIFFYNGTLAYNDMSMCVSILL